LILGAGPPTLVDTGSGRGQCTPQILAGLETVRSEFHERLAPADIRRILITHSHVDHIGGLAELVEITRAEVGVHPLDSRAVANFDEQVVVIGQQARQFFHHAGVPGETHQRLVELFGLLKGRVRSVPVGFMLHDGEPLDGLRLLHTPGHSPGQVCIGVEDILLTADHILPVTIPQQWPETVCAYYGLGHYLHALEKIAAVPGFTLGLGGHEGPIRELYPRIVQIQETQFRRLDRVLQLLHQASEPMSVQQIASRLFSHTPGFQQLLALMDAGARVEYLYQRGRLAIGNLDEVERDAQAARRYQIA
jgi:glyoxylase-like metal-dependent hydrolase (beta-lactamase superfamily II)